MLLRRGLTAWRRALTELTGAASSAAATRPPLENTATAAGDLPVPVATELVNALAAVALAGASAPGPSP